MRPAFTVLLTYMPAKFELTKNKTSVLRGELNTTKASSIKHPHLASASTQQ